MKKKYIHLYIYIAYIVICLFVRIFTEYDSWHSVVTAVTISGALIVYADIFTSSANVYEHYQKEFGDSTFNKLDDIGKGISELETLCDEKYIEGQKKIDLLQPIYNNITDDYNNKTQEERCDEAKELVEKLGKEISELEIDIDKEYDNSLNEIDSMREQYKEIEEFRKELRDKAEECRKYAVRNNIFSYILTIIAFVSLMCIMTFEKLQIIAAQFESQITVLSFALVLESKIIDDIMEEKMDQVSNLMESYKQEINEVMVKTGQHY